MDIKDFILIVGGLMIAAVLAHGFWIAWRARREPLRLDIVPELIPENHDEMDRFRGELPNGGARPATPEQVALELEGISEALGSHARDEATGDQQGNLPLGGMGASHGAVASISDDARRALDRELLGDPPETAVAKRAPTPKTRRRVPKEPDLFTIPEGFGPEEPTVAPATQTPAATSNVAEPAEPTANEGARPRVAEVSLEPIVADPLVTEPKPKADLRPRRAANQPLTDRASGSHKPRRLGGFRKSEAPEPTKADSAAESSPVEDLILIHLIAPRGARFEGNELFDALREQGLKFTDRSIFQREDPMLKSAIYSVANALQPGFFDLSNMDAMRTPGVTFFLQLPGPEDPAAALEEMLQAAQNVAHTLGGLLLDDEKNRLTRQIANHMKQRVSDFTLKRLSRKAL